MKCFRFEIWIKKIQTVSQISPYTHVRLQSFPSCSLSTFLGFVPSQLEAESLTNFQMPEETGLPPGYFHIPLHELILNEDQEKEIF